MQITILKSKIHRATVTQADINYEGSITIDYQFMRKTGIYPYEKVLVSNMNRGTRCETYAIKGKPGSGIIGLNGAAAKLGKAGDKLTIMAFTNLHHTEAKKFKPKIILLGEGNKIRKIS